MNSLLTSWLIVILRLGTLWLWILVNIWVGAVCRRGLGRFDLGPGFVGQFVQVLLNLKHLEKEWRITALVATLEQQQTQQIRVARHWCSRCRGWNAAVGSECQVRVCWSLWSSTSRSQRLAACGDELRPRNTHWHQPCWPWASTYNNSQAEAGSHEWWHLSCWEWRDLSCFLNLWLSLFALELWYCCVWCWS